MEAQKRKRGDDRERKRSEEKGAINKKEAEAEAPEEEVEEFFAILRRMHVAVKYFEKNNDGKRWKPSFEKEDFQQVSRDIEPEKKEEDCVDENSGLDLNLDPPSENNSV